MTDDDRRGKPAADAARHLVARIRRADHHPLGKIMQRDRKCHDKPRDKQLTAQFLLLRLLVLLFMFLVVIAVDELRQLIRRLGMVFINMLDLGIRPPVHDRIQHIDKHEADCRHGNDQEDMPHRIGHLRDRVRQQVEADDAQHDAARKTQKQADDLLGIAGKQNADQPAQPGTDDAGDRRDDNNKCKSSHKTS